MSSRDALMAPFTSQTGNKDCLPRISPTRPPFASTVGSGDQLHLVDHQKEGDDPAALMWSARSRSCRAPSRRRCSPKLGIDLAGKLLLSLGPLDHLSEDSVEVGAAVSAERGFVHLSISHISTFALLALGIQPTASTMRFARSRGRLALVIHSTYSAPAALAEAVERCRAASFPRVPLEESSGASAGAFAAVLFRGAFTPPL
jgi:hypothetical protein